MDAKFVAKYKEECKRFINKINSAVISAKQKAL